MEYDGLNDERNPPGSSQNFGEGGFQIRDVGAVDRSQASRPDLNSSAALFMPTPVTNVRPSISSCLNMDGVYQSYPHDPRVGNNSITGVTRHNYIQSPQYDPSFSPYGGGLINVDASSSGLQNSEVVREIPLAVRSNTAGGYQKNDQISETEGKVDGSFLTLGIGSDPEARSRWKFDPRQIASRLEEAALTESSNFYSQPATNAFPNLSNDFSSFNSNSEWTAACMKFNHREIASNLEEDVGHRSISSSPHLSTSVYPNFTNGFSTFSSNPVAFVEPVSNMGTWTSPLSDGLMQAALANPYCGLHFEEPFQQRANFENDDSTLGFLDTSIGKQSVSQSCTYSLGGPPTLLQLKNAYSYQTLPGFTRPCITSQPSGEALGTSHSRNTGDVSASFVSNSSKATGSSVTRDYLGQLSSTDGAHSVYAYGHRNFPDKTFLQPVASNSNKTLTGALYPRRLGVQINDASANVTAATQSSNQSFTSMDVGVQTIGHHQTHLPFQSNIPTPSTATGQMQQGLPTSVELAKVMHTSGQVQLANRNADGPSQVHSRGAQKSLKRKAQESLAVPSWGHRRRFTIPQYPKGDKDMPAASSAHPQIKWTGFDRPPLSEPHGHRCLLCKLDLVYEPERMPPVANNPPVAVLPCGHTFHDHCLQLITPDSEKHDPPCIPCAIGET